VSMDYDSIEEMKVMGLGAPAEYGGFSGAIVNTVTKSGGNDFSALLTFYLQMPKWHSDNWGNNPELIRRDWDEAYNAHFNFGGPIIKDKLWFFTSGLYDYWHLHIDEYDGPTEYGDEYRFNGKFTWQPNGENRFTVMLEWNKDSINNIEAGPFSAPEAVPSEGARQYYRKLFLRKEPASITLMLLTCTSFQTLLFWKLSSAVTTRTERLISRTCQQLPILT